MDDPNSKEYVTVLQADEKPMLTAGVQDPTVGLYSDTSSNKTGVLNKTLDDAIEDIVAGRRPRSDCDGLVSVHSFVLFPFLAAASSALESFASFARKSWQTAVRACREGVS